jgi:hypothetical protein
MNRFYNISFPALYEAGHADPAGESDRLFPAVVQQSSLHLFKPNEPVPMAGTRILIGIATWSGYDLRLLDLLDTALTRMNGTGPVIDVLNLGSMSQAEIAAIFPGIEPINHTPVLAIWKDGKLTETASGFAARDRIAKMFGSSSDEITRFVREKNTCVPPAQQPEPEAVSQA